MISREAGAGTRNINHHNSKWCKWCCTRTTTKHWGTASKHTHILGWQSSIIGYSNLFGLGQCNQSYQFKVFAPAAPHWLGTSIGVLPKKINGHRDDMGWPWLAKADFASGGKMLHLEWAAVHKHLNLNSFRRKTSFPEDLRFASMKQRLLI